MLLYIIRHAYAYEHGDPRWPDDSKRPLAPEGGERFRRGVEGLASRGLQPEVIATSPYVRCRQTAEIVAAEVSGKPEVIDHAALAPGSDLDELIAWSNRQNANSVAWVGHSPDVEHFAASLIAETDANLRFAKGAAAAIRFPDGVERGGGELQWLVTLKALGA